MIDQQRNPPAPREKVGEHVTIYKRGTTWWAMYQLDRQQRRETLSTSNVKEARRKALIIESEVLRGVLDAAPPPISIDQTITEYLAHVQVEGRAKRTIDKYRRTLGKLQEVAKSKRVSSMHQVNLRLIDAYRKARKDEGCSKKTIHDETTIARQLVNFALSRKLLNTDPLAGLKNPKTKPTEQPCWTTGEVEQILCAAPAPLKSIFAVLADTGMRIGELQWLTWNDIDLHKEVIHIRPKEGWKPKSGETRQVPMTERVKEVLSGRSRRFPWVFTAGVSKKYPQGGNQVSERRLLRSLKRLLKRIGLPEVGKLHTFRHSFISKALARGIPSTTVCRWVGHVSDEILDLYNHIHEAEARAAMRQFENLDRVRSRAFFEMVFIGSQRDGCSFGIRFL